jgi:hypothetical protein
MIRRRNSQSQSAARAPIGEIALEAKAFGNLKGRDEATLDLLPGFACRFARSPILPPGLIKVGNKSVAIQRGRLK